MRVRPLLVIVAMSLAGAGAASSGTTQSVPLNALTVPAAALTGECRLQPPPSAT